MTADEKFWAENSPENLIGLLGLTELAYDEILVLLTGAAALLARDLASLARAEPDEWGGKTAVR